MTLRIFISLLFLLPGLVLGKARQVGDYQWEGVERVIVVGDIHGDLDGYMATLRAAGLVDKRGRWDGGETHLVQLGDLPDRGPDTLEIIEHIGKLARQAERAGGRVHSLLGNHEIMNVTGDLRYVHPGEFEAFATRKSGDLQDRYLELYLQQLEQTDPEAYAALPEDFSEQWKAKHPPGWLEHRQAWDPRWNPEAELAAWAMQRPTAIRIDDSLFVHGGISYAYCGNSLASLSERAAAELADYDPAAPGILEDPLGPFWYRGLSGGEPRALPETVDAILERHGVRRIVVGHTPTSGVVWPAYDGRVVQADTGISAYYGGYLGYLEITPQGRFAGYKDARLPLPEDDDASVAYLEAVIALQPDNARLQKRLQKLLAPTAEAPAGETGAESGDEGEDAAPALPICGTS
jgi:hypothetical protein